MLLVKNNWSSQNLFNRSNTYAQLWLRAREFKYFSNFNTVAVINEIHVSIFNIIGDDFTHFSLRNVEDLLIIVLFADFCYVFQFPQHVFCIMKFSAVRRFELCVARSLRLQDFFQLAVSCMQIILLFHFDTSYPSCGFMKH